MAVRLGTKVKDSITGFEGIAVQRIEYLYGCVRIGVEPLVDKDGKAAECCYFDEQRLDPTSAAVTGGDYPAPPARTAPRR